MQLLRNGEIVASPWHAPDAGADAVVSYALYQADPQACSVRTDDWTLSFAPDDDLFDLPAHLLEFRALFIEFPSFTDGRGYSHARTLRDRYGYTGELIAVGDVRRDQLADMRRCGIDAFEFPAEQDPTVWLAATFALDPAAPHTYYSGARPQGAR